MCGVAQHSLSYPLTSVHSTSVHSTSVLHLWSRMIYRCRAKKRSMAVLTLRLNRGIRLLFSRIQNRQFGNWIEAQYFCPRSSHIPEPSLGHHFLRPPPSSVLINTLCHFDCYYSRRLLCLPHRSPEIPTYSPEPKAPWERRANARISNTQ